MHKNIAALFIVIFALCTRNASLLAPQEQVRMMRFVPGSNDKLLVLIMADGVVKICDAQAKTVLQEICRPGLQAAALTAVGRIEKEWKGYTVDKVLPVKVWDMIMEFLPDTDRLALQLTCKGINSIYNARLERKYAPLQNLAAVLPGPAKVTSMNFSHDGKTLVVSLIENGFLAKHEGICIYSLSEEVNEWKLDKAMTFNTACQFGPSVHVACSPNGRTIVFSVDYAVPGSSFGNRCIELWHRDATDNTWKKRQEHKPSGVVKDIKFSSFGNRFAIIEGWASRATRDIRVFVKNGKEDAWQQESFHKECGYEDTLESLNTDNNWLLCRRGRYDLIVESACIYNPLQQHSHNIMSSLKNCIGAQPVLSMVKLPGGQLRACVRMADENIGTWQTVAVDKWEFVGALSFLVDVFVHKSIGCENVVLSPNGNAAVVWSSSPMNRNVLVWDCNTGAVLANFGCTVGKELCSASFSPDGNWLALAYHDGSVEVHLISR